PDERAWLSRAARDRGDAGLAGDLGGELHPGRLRGDAEAPPRVPAAGEVRRAPARRALRPTGSEHPRGRLLRAPVARHASAAEPVAGHRLHARGGPRTHGAARTLVAAPRRDPALRGGRPGRRRRRRAGHGPRRPARAPTGPPAALPGDAVAAPRLRGSVAGHYGRPGP